MITHDELLRPIIEEDKVLLVRLEEIIDEQLRVAFRGGLIKLQLRALSPELLAPLRADARLSRTIPMLSHMFILYQRYRAFGWEVTYGPLPDDPQSDKWLTFTLR